MGNVGERVVKDLLQLRMRRRHLGMSQTSYKITSCDWWKSEIEELATSFL